MIYGVWVSGSDRFRHTSETLSLRNPRAYRLQPFEIGFGILILIVAVASQTSTQFEWYTTCILCVRLQSTGYSISCSAVVYRVSAAAVDVLCRPRL
jgi:hypothetical protein